MTAKAGRLPFEEFVRVRGDRLLDLAWLVTQINGDPVIPDATGHIPR